MQDFVTILALVVLGFIFFCIYFIFKQMQFVIQAINLYKDMIVRQDAMIKILKDIRDGGTVGSSKAGTKKTFDDDVVVSKSTATDSTEQKNKLSPEELQSRYNNGECPSCAAKIEANSVRCQECNEKLFDYAQRAYEASKK